jgi:predicted DsbA family dithiol-disulfide isomerase
VTTPLQIDFVADLVCPWCYVGWAHLQQALALRPQIGAQIVWRPFQLDPTTPPEGRDRAAHLARKFPDKARLDAVHDHLAGLAAAAGLDMRLREVEKIPNTAAAHALILQAREAGCEPALVESLLRAYWTELRDIGDPAVLVDVAVASGLERDVATELLNSPESRDQVTRECDKAVRSGISGVPFMIFGSRVAVSGAEKPDRLVQAIDRAAAVSAA